MTAYVAYGVRLESEINLPGLRAPRGHEYPTITVRRDSLSDEGKVPAAPDAEFLVHGRPLSLHVNVFLDVDWQGICRFRVSTGDSLIRCARGPEGRSEDLQEWLLHYALPLLLLTEGHLHFLHGSAVQVGDRAVGFLAPSGGGKTTLAEYFLCRGHAFFTDEKLGFALRGKRYMAVPSTPFYRRDAANARWQMVTNFASSPAPLDPLYLLVPSDSRATPAVMPVRAGVAAFELARRCEFGLPRRVRERLQLKSFQSERFETCTELAAATRVRRLVVPRDLARLPEVYDTVVADVARRA